MTEATSETPESGLDMLDGLEREELSETPNPIKRDDSFMSKGSEEGLIDGVFDVKLSEVTEDPNQVNVHQFYPQLEHQFMKGHGGHGDQRLAIAGSVSSGWVPDSAMDSRALVPSTNSAGTPWSKDDENNSSDPQKSQQTQQEDKPSQSSEAHNVSAPGGPEGAGVDSPKGDGDDGLESVFSTAVDEQTLAEAKERRGQGVGRPGETGIFQTEKWGMEKPPQPSLKQIMDDTAMKHFTKALKLKEEKNYQSAILFINKALTIHKDDVRFYVERAEAYLNLCDFQSAILNYKKACLMAPSNQEYYERLAFLYFFQGQSLFDQRLYPEALEAFSRSAEMCPDNIGYHIRSITCLAALQRHGECLALVNKQLETDKNNADLYIMRARLHEMFRNTTLCYYDVKDALGIDPDHVEASHMMARLETVARDNRRQAMQLNLMSKHREALQKISIAIETDPAVADFHVLRGALHRKLGDYNAAIDDFLLALDKCDHEEESPVYIDSQRQLLLTYNDFAVECFSKGFFEEAIILLNKAIKGEKREKGLYVNRGDCFFRQDEFSFAMQDYEQALEMDPSDDTIKSRISVIHNEFGVQAYQDKMFPEAEKRFSQALEFHPKVGQYYISRSRARYMMENMTGARGDLIMGLLLDPDNEDVISILSRLFPGKSVGDVLASRAAESAKMAIRNIFHPPRSQQTQQEGEEESVASGDEEAADDVQSEKQEEPELSGVTGNGAEAVWKPGTAVSEFRFMMDEKEFNIKLVELKQTVNSKVKTALLDRKSLKYDGPRMQPLPPPQPKPSYGGRGIRKEGVITTPGKQSSTNWRTFSMGIGLGGN